MMDAFETETLTQSARGDASHRLSSRLPRGIIARRAYHIWQSHGCPEGTAADDWLQAEAELHYAAQVRRGRLERRRDSLWARCDLMIDEAAEESFPASDPPALPHCSVT